MSAIRTAAAIKDLPAGSVIQTKYVEERGEPTTSGETNPPGWLNMITLFSISMTPLLPTSKILLKGSGGVSVYASPSYQVLGMIGLWNLTTFLVGVYPNGYSDGPWVAWDFEILHTPGASETYTVYYASLASTAYTAQIYINGYTYGNATYMPVTSFTAQEIKQ